MVFWSAGCLTTDRARTPEEKGIQRTDFLHDFASIYEANLPSQSGSERVIVLVLYNDGSCLWSDRQLNGTDTAVSTGRWDHSDFHEHITLHLKSRQGARLKLTLEIQDRDLKYTEPRYSDKPILLVRR